MAFIPEYGSVDVVVPVNQSIIIASFGPGTAVISTSNAPLSPAVFTETTRLSNASTTLGAFTKETIIRIAAADCDVEYVTGTAPALTASQFNGNRPVIAFVDSSGTAGNVTNNSPRGRVAFAAAATTVTVTSSIVTASSMVIATLRTADGTLTQILRVLPTAGSFTITANAASTGTAAQADFLVIN